MNYFFNPFEVSEDGPHRRPHHHHHPYGPDGFNGFRVGRHGPPPHFGHDARREWGPFRREGHHDLPPWFFEAFAGRGGGFGPHRGGRGGFGFHGRGGFGHGGGFVGPRGWDPVTEAYNSSSEEEEGNPKMPQEIVVSDDSDVEYLGEEKCPKESRCRRRCGKNETGGCRGRRFGRGGKNCGRGGFKCHRFAPRGRCPWRSEAEEAGEEIIPVEDASATDFQIIQDDVTAEISNLQLQPDLQQNKSNKKCFKISLNVDGFKAKDIRIRRNSDALLIEGKQNASIQLGTFQRSFAYKITIPTGIDPKKIKTRLGFDGVLRIKGKKSRKENESEDVEEEILLQE